MLQKLVVSTTVQSIKLLQAATSQNYRRSQSHKTMKKISDETSVHIVSLVHNLLTPVKKKYKYEVHIHAEYKYGR